MTPHRDVTWTSLLGRIYRTRAHDYRQYSTLFCDAVATVHDDVERALADDRAAHARAKAEGRTTRGIDGRGEPRDPAPLTRQAALSDAVDRAVYRALTYRGPARPLRSGDDDPECDTHPGFLGWDAVSLTHVRPDGRRRHGPDPATADAEREAQRAAGAGAGTGTGRPGATDAAGWRHAHDQAPPPF
ncbi:hypothetical protein [Ornithinimicrobium pekingense]|uniref:DivIVA domain-containing protein n=1 Tax=Ornithinimicrobium pekingense TaxID=384677 RepID=A0ABQ2F619_9MICO|nr:hypothetical protein [Ornithinimicrobium pekingense]GGK64829.1 hypothetical protein GCM10011509_11440 [Ornithinimicrobium pekingense]